MTFTNSISKTFSNQTTKKISRNGFAQSKSSKTPSINHIHGENFKESRNSLPKTHSNLTILKRNTEKLDVGIEQFPLKNSYPLCYATVPGLYDNTIHYYTIVPMDKSSFMTLIGNPDQREFTAKIGTFFSTLLVISFSVFFKKKSTELLIYLYLTQACLSLIFYRSIHPNHFIWVMPFCALILTANLDKTSHIK